MMAVKEIRIEPTKNGYVVRVDHGSAWGRKDESTWVYSDFANLVRALALWLLGVSKSNQVCQLFEGWEEINV